MTLLFTHEACILHDMGAGHPEQPARLTSILEAIEEESFDGLEQREAPKALREEIARVHPDSHIDLILNNIPDVGLARIDGDTALCPHSGEAALRSAGAAVAAVDAVFTDENHKSAFCATRPPGHHAEPDQAMGFCLFSNAAIAAAHARAKHGITRVAVVDFDVHHGNGTEACFLSEPDFLYISTHQSPLYPGTGHADMTGPHGNILNCPLPPSADGDDLKDVFERKVLPALTEFKPELIIISAGFDAHRDDPLAQMDLVEEDFAWATAQLCDIARSNAQGRIISILEGGYDLDALALSAVAHLHELLQHDA